VFDQRVAFASAEDKMEKDVAARMRHCLPPLQGWSRSGPTHGLRRGLHSFAALRLFATAILGHSRLGPISFSKLLRGLERMSQLSLGSGTNFITSLLRSPPLG
jgi:hypothetical protein